MSLALLAKSLRQGEVLLPRLREFLLRENEKREGGLLKSKDIVISDALMTIKCFLERILEYNHGEFKGNYFHPSQLGTCMRALWFDAKKAPRDALPTAEDLLRELMIFETGTYVGVVFQNLCERAGYLTQREVPIVNRELQIMGHADGMLKIDGRKYVLELKTINSRGFTGLTVAKDAHVRQIHAYMKALDKKWGIIIYMEKDRHALKEFVIPFNPGFYKKNVEGRINDYFAKISGRNPPDREGANPNLFPCRWCQFKRICFGTGELKKFIKQNARIQSKV